jgi:hypothetical protein
MNKKILRQRCKEKGLKNYYNLTKYELIALLNSEFTEEFYNSKELPREDSKEDPNILFSDEKRHETKKEVYTFLQTSSMILGISAISLILCIYYLN